MRSVVRRFLALHRTLTAVFRVVARVVCLPLLIVTFLVGVVFPWAIPIFLKGDPIWAPRRPASRWVPRDTARPWRTRALWSKDPAPRSLRGRRQARMLLPRMFLVIGLSLGGKDLYRNLAGADGEPWNIATTSRDTQRPTTALADAPWIASWNAAFAAATGDAAVTLYAGDELADVSSPHLNITKGVRRSWQPPLTTCAAPVRVWAFGGSSMFGVGQRDHRTLASELASAAWRDGVTLDVQNRAVPRDVAWIERARLERALAAGETAPDLVIFYDGFNDLRAVEWTHTAGHVTRGRFLGLYDRSVFPMLNHLREETYGDATTIIGVPFNHTARAPDAKVIADTVRFQYDTARALTDADLVRAGIASIAFVQPTGASRTPQIPGDFHTTRLAAEHYRTFRDDLPDGVIDISDALNDHPDAVYVDDVNTTEGANPVIATRMWSEMRDLVASITTQDTTCPRPAGP